jgi:two-component system chemotaxis response regulator CheY
MHKVLIVDDAKLMRNILKTTIQEGFGDVQFIEAADGEQAVELYKKESPGLVTMDITMEQKNGLDAARDILAFDKNAKIIVVTAMGQEKLLRDCIQAGIQDFIVKPFLKERVRAAVSRVLQKN